MIDYTKEWPDHTGKYIGEHDLFLEVFEGDPVKTAHGRPPLLFVHGAFTGSWMWGKYIPHFIGEGWPCYVMNLRSHYKSRVMDMTTITFENYLEDIQEVIAACGMPPVLIGFSMGGILGQKLAETVRIAGLVLVDSVISREVHEAVPYQVLEDTTPGIIQPAPTREEDTSLDESADDIAFQRKYLAMESSRAVRAFSFSSESKGISINSRAISCPCLVIKAVASDEDDRRGRVTAEHLRAAYQGLWNTTHTGLLAGQRYKESVDIILDWLKRY
ncbi:alpha/beta fold hydrolase [Paenibacillus mucilaginosus]|uniref:Hydrolase n=3 Tax=Paenibacillus mucilaginosus TaxID=61624 RepID=I0BL34_9BACL|nr:alpha/beta hydrolase family protein [Paenibacillus mucilaginosus]AEI43081.1 putative hydrolase protein [Paenibacillus mucilaginosus KNP414]AFC30758.1 putative hydrolase protein [Paenibacillus mucilaginosus 3016]AFH63081.1 hydrolase [Paenibacillus mucilaginosus K02]MCG7212344.1 alpha/beta fold hydrolase [Paenibacillus mucilaginosus]WDM24698.1 alpha/beta fold hydrolase [Paenibacillus mucilaginosus]